MTVIAMTREIGSLGTEVAAGVAKKLHLKIIDSEDVAAHVAGRMGIQEGTIRRYADGSASILDRWLINRRKLSHYTSEEVLRLAYEGDVLIRGWGAATLLRDMPRVISVRVCAPIAFRVRTMMRKMGVNDPETVRQEIQRFDDAHARVMRDFFKVESEDALLYHLVLNTDRMPVELCVKAVCELARDPRHPDHGTTRSALADKLLEAKINSALGDQISASMAPAGISVSARNGRVTLVAYGRGNLRAEAQKVAAQFAGVHAIDNRIMSVPSHGRRF
jgi:cytidylate kinase